MPAQITPTAPNGQDWYDRLPKVELHLHLEGAIPLPTLWTLIQKYGGDPDTPDIHALQRRFSYRDFPHFIETWIWKNHFLREYEDFTFMAEAVARDLASQNIRYVEAFYSPPDFISRGLKTQLLTEAVRSGLRRVPEIEISLIADVVRDFGPDRAMLTLSEVNEVKNSDVIGIGLGGSEQLFPAGPFQGVFQEARRLGFHTTAHAGEGAGPESIWSALKDLGTERIGHGTRAVEDGVLLDYLGEKEIPIEACPISNVRTSVVNSLEEHPIRSFFERGFLVSVNTDDPKMFGNSMAEEYRLLVEKLGFSRQDVLQLIANSIHSSWATRERKESMIAAFETAPAWKEASGPAGTQPPPL